METIKVGLLGFGTVGTGVAKTLLEHQSTLKSRNIAVELKRIADLDIHTDRGVKIDRAMLTTNVNEILDDPEIQIVIELIGGCEPAKSFILKAIRNGKHIVTANKALLAEHGQEIFEAANRHYVDIGFEASVAGGIPIIRSLREGFVANQFTEIYGILNGTTNYILTEMQEKGEKFTKVLKQAQKLGIAEADPSFDIEGTDAAYKIAILTYLAFGRFVKIDQIFTEGIRNIHAMDIKFAKEFGYTIKLLAIIKMTNNAVEIRVHPTMLSEHHLLAKVGGSLNAIYVIGDIVGSTMFYGHGAGAMPTASAVVGDVVDIARNIMKGISNKVPLLYKVDESQLPAFRSPDQFSSRYYLRFTSIDRPGVLSKISGVLAEYHINIASVIQKETHPVNAVPVVMLTYEAPEHNMQQALTKIDALPVLTDKTKLIRVLDSV